MTERDVLALRWIGDQFAIRFDMLRVLLGRWDADGVPLPEPKTLTEPATRRQIRRWAEAGWVTRQRLVGNAWVVPTRAGLTRARHEDRPPLGYWTPAESRLRHVWHSGLVRLAYERDFPGSEWTSDRLIEQDRVAEWKALPKDARPGVPNLKHVPDAEVVMPDGRRMAVEVELTIKAEARYVEALRYLGGGKAEVRWLTYPGQVERLRGYIAAAAAQFGRPTPVEVDQLPDVVLIPPIARGQLPVFLAYDPPPRSGAGPLVLSGPGR